MGNINDNVKRLIRYNNIPYKEFAKRIGLGVGTIRSAFSRDKDEVWMRALDYGYELGSRVNRDDMIEVMRDGKKVLMKGGIDIGFGADSSVIPTWQEKLKIQKGEI